MTRPTPRKTPQMEALELETGLDIREVLRAAYAEHGGIVGAAAALGITHGTFSVWVQLLGGEIRSEVAFSACEPAGASV